MISLHEQGCIDMYAAHCNTIWKQWPKKTSVLRESAFIEAIRNVAGKLISPPNFNFTVMPAGTNGSFGKTSWTLKVNRSRPQADAITMEEFVNFCRTVYHETRHAEQYFRVAQGLAVGRLEFPGATAAAVTGVSVGQALKIQKLLNIPMEVAQRAVITKADYERFAMLPKAKYCLVGSGLNWDPTVDDWLELTYHPARGGFSDHGQNANGGVMEEQFYWRSVEEIDAFACGDAVREKLKTTMTDYTANAKKPRTDPAFA